MKNYEIEYRDCTGMRCGEEIEAVSEKEAIKHCQQTLLLEGDYMTELISIDDVSFHDEEPVWSIEDGPILDKEDQDALNDAFNTYLNEDGLTIKQVLDNK